MAANQSVYNVALTVGCNATSVQRVADALGSVTSSPANLVRPRGLLSLCLIQYQGHAVSCTICPHCPKPPASHRMPRDSRYIHTAWMCCGSVCSLLCHARAGVSL